MLKPLSSKAWAAKYFPVIKIAGDPTVKAPVALNKSVCVIGRRLGVHLPLNSTKVSKVHALIVRQRNNVYIRDLASRNHVYVNGLAVRETDLDTGDSVKVGPYTLHCESGFTQSAQVAARPTPPPVPAPDATLQIVGEDAPRPLEGRALLIGQREDCDLVLDDQRVSPVHAVIFELDGKHVLRDLNWLFNATQSSIDFDEDPVLSGSVINYGMPPLAGRPASQYDLGELSRVLREVIMRFEPRIISHTLKVTAERAQADSHNVLGFRIEGQLWSQPIPLEIYMRTEIDLESGMTQVVESKAP